MRKSSALAALLLLLIPQLTAAESTDLHGLLGAFARMPGLEAGFVEEKHIGLLAQPLTSRGRLFFARPGLLLRRVESPQRSQVVITPKEMRDDNGEQTIDLRSRPDIRPFIESLTWLLSGDQKALANVYGLEFKPAVAAEPWQLTLTPKVAPLDQLIAYIRVLGRGLAVSEIQVREKRGDETVTRITSANPERRFSNDELAQLFGVTPVAKPPAGKR
jgi:outer membrane lipoprotein-sorting protein